MAWAATVAAVPALTLSPSQGPPMKMVIAAMAARQRAKMSLMRV